MTHLVLGGLAGGQAIGDDDPGGTSFAPYAYATIADPDAGASETTSITLAQNGAARDAAGLLSGAGVTKTRVGTYVLAAASPAAETAALQALRFTPSHPGVAASRDMTLTVADGAGTPVSPPSTLGLAGDPGGASSSRPSRPPSAAR